jgi:hypothetical protein
MGMVIELLSFTVERFPSCFQALLVKCSGLLLATGCTAKQVLLVAIAKRKVKVVIALLKHTGTAVPLDPHLQHAVHSLAKTRKADRSDAVELLSLLHPSSATS